MAQTQGLPGFRAVALLLRVLPPLTSPADRGPELRRIRLVGLGALLLMVLTGGRLAAPIGQVAPTGWLGLLGAFSAPAARGAAGVGLISGLVGAAWAFLGLLRLAAGGQVGVRAVAGTALVWSVPVLLGPPLMSLDVHSYAAQGEMLDRGLDPYRIGPEFIRGPFYDPVDPRWRAARAPYGPLALLLSRGAVVLSGHDAVWSVVLLRLVAAVSVAAAAVLVVRLAADPAVALTLVAACPLVLITLVSAAHHEAVVAVLVLGALVAQRSGRSFLAVALAAAALADKLPGAVALGTLGVLHLSETTGWGSRLRVLARDGLAVACVWVPLALAVPDPLGWVKALSTPGLGHTGYAPVSLVAFVTRIPEDLVRAAGEILSVLVVGRLLLTVRRRPLGATVGWGLLAVALLGPVLYPWYLAPAALVLATTDGAVARWMSAACGAWGLLLRAPGWRADPAPAAPAAPAPVPPRVVAPPRRAGAHPPVVPQPAALR